MKATFAVAASLVVMVAWCLLFLVPLYLALGADAALAPGGAEFSTFWVGMAMVVCLAAAVWGGWLVHAWSGRLSAVVALACVLLVAGYADAGLHAWLRVHPDAFSQTVAVLRLGLLTPEPIWYDWMLPIPMAIFAWVAGKSRAIEMTPNAAPRIRPALRRAETP